MSLPGAAVRKYTVSVSRTKREDIRMRKPGVCTLALLFTILAAAPTMRAQDLSQADKDRALQYLETTKNGVVNATKGLSDAQWNYKPGPERWSIAEVMEHLAAAEDLIRGLVEEQVMKTAAIPAREPAELKKIDDSVIAMVPDRSHKMQAPDPLKPTNRFGSPEEAEKHFLESRATTAEYLKTTPDLRAHAIDSPMGMKLDAYEWVLLIAAHSDRHTKQMLEVKADPNFPKQ
jgi:uncharacterized damage-inducible protein DinB